MITKKDLVRLADSLRGQLLSGANIEAICEFCAASNPRFNKDLWLGYLRGKHGPNGGALRRGNNANWDRDQ